MASLLWSKDFGESEGKIHVVPAMKSLYIRNWERMFAAHKIRRIDMTSGEELARYPTRAFSNLSFSDDYKTLFANTDKRILLLDTEDLSEIERWESRVPRFMSSTIQVGHELAMRKLGCEIVNLYDLQTTKVKRIKIGRGNKVRRDIKSDTFLAVCEYDGTVYRVDAASRRIATLYAGSPFISGVINYETKTIWLGDGIRQDYDWATESRPPKPKKVVDVISLKDGTHINQLRIKFEFELLGVSKRAMHVWLGHTSQTKNCSCPHVSRVSILDVQSNVKELERFEVPKSEWFIEADPQSGLIFTLRTKGNPREPRMIVTCWKL